MSLFGDLPEARTPAVKGAGNPANSSAVATAARLQPSIVRKAAAFAATPSVLRAGRVRGGVASSGGGHGASQDAEGDAASASAPAAGPAPHSIFSGGSGAPIQDEYDPARPNNYEELRSARDEKQRQAEEAEKRQAQIRQLQQLAEQRAARIAEEAKEEAEAYASSGIPPEQDPPYQEADRGPSGSDAEAATGAEARRQSFVSMSGEEAFRRRAALSGAAAGGAAGGRPDEGAGFGSGAGAGLGFSAAGASAPDAGMPGSGKAVKGMSLAQKMLEKLGWRAGEGLGKNRQGMAEPLVAKKTDTRSGVIVNATAQAPAPRPDEQPSAKRPKTQGSVFQGAPSRVVLLKNLVGPGGVDEELEDEVAGELSKYGAVQKVRIFEVTEPGFPEDQAVRIFVQFDRVESTTKAVVELQGRFFGGRTVSANFYDEQLFERKELAPQPHELP